MFMCDVFVESVCGVCACTHVGCVCAMYVNMCVHVISLCCVCVCM